MINYLKSENYRILHKKSLYIITIVCLALVIAAGMILKHFGEMDETFKYDTARFYYSNVVAFSTLIILIGLLFNLMLTSRKETKLLKQSVAFGISRTTVYWSKLLLTLLYFSLSCIVIGIIVVVIGSTFFAEDSKIFSNFIIAILNMLPIVLSSFIVVHTFNMLKVSEVYTVFSIIIIYVISGKIVWGLSKIYEPISSLQKYTPEVMLDNILVDFMKYNAQIDWQCWVIGLAISIAALVIGLMLFNRKSID